MSMTFQYPDIGRPVRVVVETLKPAGEVFYHIPDTTTFEGKVVALGKLDDADTLNMSTGTKIFPVRNIRMERIMSIVYTDTKEELEKQEVDKPHKRVFEFPSSKGDKTYTVILENDRWKCSCKGFQFRNTCKHVNQAKETL